MASVLFVLALMSILSNSTAKEEFDCIGLNTKACKAAFGKFYEREFKYLHVNAMEAIGEIFETISMVIVEELPDGDCAAERLNQTIYKVHELIPQFRRYKNDHRKIFAVVSDLMKAISWHRYASSRSMRKLGAKYGIIPLMTDRMNLFAIDVANLYLYLFAELRKQDCLEHPEFLMLYRIMKILQEPKKSQDKFNAFYYSVRIFLFKFDLMYMNAIKQLVI